MSAPLYEFDEAFQTKVAALAVRDATFNLRTDGLVDPGYFGKESEATLVAITQRYWDKYKTVPSSTVLVKLVKDAIANKTIRADMVGEVRATLKTLLTQDVSDRDYVIDEVAAFARHQALIAAMEKSVDALDKRDFERIEAEMSKAMRVGVNAANEGHDFWESIEQRSEHRKDILAGVTIPAITSGFKELDDALDNNGFTRGEMAVILGPAKRGKSFLLMNVAVNASIAGYNVLFISLENSTDVTTRRADSYVAQTTTRDILSQITAVETAVKGKAAGKRGKLMMHEFPTGSFAPKDLRRLVENYRAKGLIFDEIVVDYWDIMAPDIRYKDDGIRESASIGIGLRAIAKEENAAMVTAIQSNRDGFKAHTAGAEHAAEDFNKVRLADALFSINADDDERARGEARIYMAAVRNMEGGYTLNIKQDLSKATFITSVMGRAGI